MSTLLAGKVCVGAEFVIDAYHPLWRIEKSFRMFKHDRQARPIYHHKRESIDTHLTIVFAALAVSHYTERQTGWSIKKFVRTARRYHTVRIKAARQILTAADPLPDDLRVACQGDGTTVLPWVWDRVFPVAGRVVMVTDDGRAGQSDGVGWAGFPGRGFCRCR